MLLLLSLLGCKHRIHDCRVENDGVHPSCYCENLPVDAEGNDTSCDSSMYRNGICCAGMDWPGGGNLNDCTCEPNYAVGCYKSGGRCYCQPDYLPDGGVQQPGDSPEPNCAAGAVYQHCCLTSRYSCSCGSSACTGNDLEVMDCVADTKQLCGDPFYHRVSSCSD
jgi:hypothetical protein